MIKMEEGQLPELPEEFEASLKRPYAGLFGDNVQIRIVTEIVANPYRYYRPKLFQEKTGASLPSIRKALNNLVDLGLLSKDADDPQHPLYVPNLDSKKLLALTFLAYAFIDDRDGTDCLDDAIKDYCEKAKKDSQDQSRAKGEKAGNRDYIVER
jgi:hypothetical protein